jgi:RNA polymerase sigma factor (sigma-70 family)
VCVGPFLAELRHIEKLSFEEECRLFDLWKAGSAEARRRILEAHLPWVVRIARNYRRHAIPLADLIQIGVLGLIAAVDSKSYDPRRRRLFKASYFQVNSAIREAIETSSTVIHVPRRHHRGKLAGELEPLKARARGQFYSIDDGDLRLRDILSCNGDQAHAAEVLDDWAKLWRTVDGLPAHEAATVRMYYLDDCTFRQIGQALGVTPQTAHKYHGRAIRRLQEQYVP